MRKRFLKQVLNVFWWRLGGKNPLFGPLRVQWDLTYKCNSRCRHCTRWRADFKKKLGGEPELTTAQAQKLLRQLADLGMLQITFSGNEPLLRPDIFELMALAKKLGLSVTLTTNGLALDKKIAQKIVESGIDVLFISLDGPTDKIHDRVRGIKGALKKALKAAELVRAADGEKRLKIMTTIVASKNNLGNLVKTVALAKKAGFDGAIVQPIIFFPTAGEGDKSLAFKSEDLSQLEAELETLMSEEGDFIPVMRDYYDKVGTYYRQPKKLYRFACSAGFLTLDIQPNGDFIPCPVWMRRMGNYKKGESAAGIWFSAEAAKVREEVRTGKHPICWAGCLWPMNLYLSFLHPLRFYKLFKPRMVAYIAKKVGF
jgi:MoaA/NifB/PqqE/SkfB family radical SAM enzyme